MYQWICVRFVTNLPFCDLPHNQDKFKQQETRNDICKKSKLFYLVVFRLQVITSTWMKMMGKNAANK